MPFEQRGSRPRLGRAMALAAAMLLALGASAPGVEPAGEPGVAVGPQYSTTHVYVAPADELRAMEERGQVLLRYTDAGGRERDDSNPNGSTNAIAGVVNETFNVFGLMPHPEHAVEAALGGEDGLKIFRSIVMSVEQMPATASIAASSTSSTFSR